MIAVARARKGPVNPIHSRVRAGLLQRACACGTEPPGDRQCDCRREHMMQRKTAVPQIVDRTDAVAPPIVHEVLRAPGGRLDPSTRAFFESRFGHDFSRVRVHSEEKAAASARAVNALAYTVGRNIVFS